MQSVLIRLREMRPDLSATEQVLADYIRRQPEQVLAMNVRELAQQSYTSPSAVIRLSKRLGFAGYRELSRALTVEIASLRQGSGLRAEKILPQDSTEQIIEKITYNNIASLEDTRNLQDEATVDACVQLLRESRHILLFGIGSSLCVARDAYLKFLRLNKPCTVNDDWHSQLLEARNASPQDVGIVFSYSGATVEMLECMKALRENSAPCIAVTRYARSPVSELATYNLYTASTETLFRSGAMASRISQLNVVDILFTLFANSEYDACLVQLEKTHIHKPGEGQP